MTIRSYDPIHQTRYVHGEMKIKKMKLRDLLRARSFYMWDREATYIFRKFSVKKRSIPARATGYTPSTQVGKPSALEHHHLGKRIAPAERHRVMEGRMHGCTTCTVDDRVKWHVLLGPPSNL
jgi:hypothetical protein